MVAILGFRERGGIGTDNRPPTLSCQDLPGPCRGSDHALPEAVGGEGVLEPAAFGTVAGETTHHPPCRAAPNPRKGRVSVET